VLIAEKFVWPSDGARNPVDAAPRKTSCFVASMRAVTLKSDVSPKSV